MMEENEHFDIGEGTENFDVGEENENFDIGDENQDLNIGEESVNLDDTSIFIPQVKADMKPIKGQEFRTLDDVEAYYKRYAKESGFCIRIHSSKLSKETSETIRKEYVCSKEGVSKVQGKKRRRSKTKTNCKASIAVVKSKNGGYVLTIFKEGHNHPLTSPRRAHMLKIHREVSAAQRSLIKQLRAVNVPTCQQYDLLGVQSGGIENIGCTKQDLYNHQRDCRNEIDGYDGDLLLQYFQMEKDKNSSFEFMIESDTEKRITQCFWADPISRRAYERYGDVVIFDTTYNTNKYGLIFAPLVGVNNHRQTVVFGCGLLSNETCESFSWLFKQFFAAMPPRDPPKMIITDQDPAMTKVISEELPQTFHRFCSWHILNKFSEKLDAAKFTTYYDEFEDCIWNSETVDEFDSKWADLVEKSGLDNNGWLSSMFDIRSTWVPAHVNHIFSAGMTSSQRAESGHCFYKRFVSDTSLLVDFMVQFTRALLHQRHNELEKDHKYIIEEPNLKCPYEMEQEMAKLYTSAVFKEFSKELWECSNYTFEFVREDSTCFLYKALRRKLVNPKGREISDQKDSNFASCSCKKFESGGIPCRHILGYLIFIKHVDELPEQYILKRWTKSPKSAPVQDAYGVEIAGDKNLLVKRNRLCQRAIEVIDTIIRSDDGCNVFEDALNTVLEKFKSSEVHQEDNPQNTMVPKKTNLPSEHIYNEPKPARFKGCGRRLKKPKDKGKAKVARKAEAQKTGRQCHGCWEYGHDKRNCQEYQVKLAKLGQTSNDCEEHISSDSLSDDEDATYFSHSSSE